MDSIGKRVHRIARHLNPCCLNDDADGYDRGDRDGVICEPGAVVGAVDASGRVAVRHSALQTSDIQRFLQHSRHALRAKVTDWLFSSEFAPLYRPVYDLGMHESRALTLVRVLAFASQQFIKMENASGKDLLSFFAPLEVVSILDQNLSTKIGVQYTLWGASVASLGSARHASILNAIDSGLHPNSDFFAPDCPIRIAGFQGRMQYKPEECVSPDKNFGVTELLRNGLPTFPGCFALTELTHGSNARGIETTITLDQASGDLIVHTPSDGAQKMWIGNAAEHGIMATVFGNLIVNGKNEGIHAVVVQIREPEEDCLMFSGCNWKFKFTKGVQIRDCGVKMGLNGVDNGRMQFDNVRVPRAHLLNRFGDIVENKNRKSDSDPRFVYSSPIADVSKRFQHTIGELVGGRVGVAGTALTHCCSALAVTLKYASHRLQFGPPGVNAPEVALLSYTTHQMWLVPLLARTVCYRVLQNQIRALYAARKHADRMSISKDGAKPGTFAEPVSYGKGFQILGLSFSVKEAFSAGALTKEKSGSSTGAQKGEPADPIPVIPLSHVELLANGIKPIATWLQIECLQRCRELCGGMGMMAQNRIGVLATDANVAVSYEGENSLLLQQVAKTLLGDLSKMYKSQGVVRASFSVFVSRLETAFVDKNPYATHRTDPDHLLDSSTLAKAFLYRYHRALLDLATELQALNAQLTNAEKQLSKQNKEYKRKTKAEVGFEAWNRCLPLALEAGKAFMDAAVLDRMMYVLYQKGPQPASTNPIFDDIVDLCPESIRSDMQTLTEIYALDVLERNAAFFLSRRYFSPRKTSAIHSLLLEKCREYAPRAVTVAGSIFDPRFMQLAPAARDNYVGQFAFREPGKGDLTDADSNPELVSLLQSLSACELDPRIVHRP
eukprot:ANDGO_02214.mRNA.1 Acyl-coenzyme A oxidase